MVLAANAMQGAVFLESLVMNLHIGSQAGQQVADEPVEAVGLAKGAQGNLEIGRAPGVLDLAAGQGKPQPGGIRFLPPRENPGPEVVEHGPGDGVLHQLADPVAKRREQIFVKDALILVGNVPTPAIEVDLAGAYKAVFHSGNSNRGRLGKVIVDNQVERSALVWRGDSRGGEVLDPDAGVEQLGLVPGDHQRAGRLTGGVTRNARRLEIEFFEIRGCGSEGLAAHLRAQLNGGPALEIVVPGCQVGSVGEQHRRHAARRRLCQQAAVIGWSPQLARRHPRHPAGAISPARSIALSKTAR